MVISIFENKLCARHCTKLFLNYYQLYFIGYYQFYHMGKKMETRDVK